MSANELLVWMSARRNGSWPQFRAAVEELHMADSDASVERETADDVGDQYTLPLYQELRLNLQRLGHAEFLSRTDGNGWRVTPPSLAVIRHGPSWYGVMAGARSRRLLQQLTDSIRPPSRLEATSAPACPDQLRVAAGDPLALAGIAHLCGFSLQYDAPAAILMNLPAVDDVAVRRRADLPVGKDWRIERWSASDFGWSDASRDEVLSASCGLFRFSLRYQRLVFLRFKGMVFQVPGQVGKYVLLRHRRHQVVRYDAGHRGFSVPAGCRPPFLVERALILCSGWLPSYETGTIPTGVLCYFDVPEAVAHLASALLRQEVQ